MSAERPMPLDLTFPGAKLVGQGAQIFTPLKVLKKGIVADAVTSRGVSLGREPIVLNEAKIIVKTEDFDEYVEHLRNNPRKKKPAKKPAATDA